ncbi:ER oxidoreductin PWA37_001373 [Arxiozyma heterogenica]|uniref:Endoplasmic oxidoreductin n=1 Tax=Arxiozyma heterogenica TaxID=278026 RepID=A0AAN7WKN6_9SACH|nr:hypothetical protein RI543_002779 [Kazachstania heterogenica]
MKLDNIVQLGSLISVAVAQEYLDTTTSNDEYTNSTTISNLTNITRSQVNTFQQNLDDLTPFCKMDKNQVLGPNCDVTITEINTINQNIRKDLVGLVNTDFFKYFKFDPFKKCTIWENNDGICFSRSCAIDMVEDWDSLPEYWQPEILGSLNNNSLNDNIPKDHQDSSFLDQLCDNKEKDKYNEQLPKVGRNSEENSDEYDINYYDIDDFASEDAGLVDLTANPERFTGYGGQQAGQIWKSIYAENCFDSSDNETEKCLAKDAFYRIVSGLHASIGTHLSNDHLNTETGEWGPNLDLFMMRVGNYPDRVSNIYFNYAIVAKALWKIKPYLKELDFCNDYDNDVKSKILNIVSQLDSKIFNEDVMFKGEVDHSLKDDFRRRFKNVTKIMDCVHCDRCKLWGKVQTTGYATSLKILFELDETNKSSRQRIVNKLTKFELISLVNTFNRLSTSVEAINNFEKMYHERENGLNNNGVASFFNNNFFKLLSKAKETICDTFNVSTTDNDSCNDKRNVNDREQTSSKVKNSKSPKFVDLKIPKKSKETFQNGIKMSNKKGFRNTIKEAWDMELHNYMQAIRFIWRSYFDLPRNLWRLFISRAAKLWNSFIGFAGYVNEEDENPIVYDLDFH